MKANEIMIGDWVIAQPDEDICGEGVGTIISRITEIYDVEGVMSVTLEDFDYPVAIGLLESIPLTGEILEKSGFEKKPRENWCYYDNYCKVVVSIAPKVCVDILGEDQVRAIVVKISGALFDIVTSIEYVHELQKALRLCGIDKTIEL